MNPKQLQRLLDAMEAGKVATDRLTPDRTFLNGWNGGIEFVENQIKKILAAEMESAN